MVNKRWKILSKDYFTFGRKLSVNVAVLGPYQSGKSTLIAQMMIQNRDIQPEVVAKFKKEAEEAKKGRFPSNILDVSKDERFWDKSIDVHRARVELGSCFVTLIDTPGHIHYTKSAISGSTQADHGILVVPGNFEVMSSELKQIEQSIMLAKVSAHNRLIILVNKMDDKGVTGSFQCNFEFARDTLMPLAKKYAFAPEQVTVIPVSGLYGYNLMTRCTLDTMSWYKGPCFREVLEDLDMPNREMHKPLRICIDRAYSVKGIGTVIVGTVIQGVVYVGQNIKIGPIGYITQIKSLHLAIPKTPVEVGLPGDHVGMAIRGLTAKECYGRRMGLVTSLISAEEQALLEERRNKKKWGKPDECSTQQDRQRQGAMFPCKTFTARVAITSPVGLIKPGYKPTLHCHNAQVPIKIVSIKEFVRKSTKQTITASGKVKQSDLLKSEFETVQSKLSIDTVARCPKLGRFLLREGYTIIGAGLVMETIYDDYSF